MERARRLHQRMWDTNKNRARHTHTEKGSCGGVSGAVDVAVGDVGGLHDRVEEGEEADMEG
eukprot:3020269-Rhodomonas_salina.1